MPLTDSPQALAAWLRLALESLGAKALLLLRHIGPPEQIFSCSWNRLGAYVAPEIAQRLAMPALPAVQRQIESALRWAEQDAHTLLPMSAPDYPSHLLTIGDAPLLLYVDGQVARLAQPGVAIVGARQATVQGRENARAFAGSLARRGLCVISGLAEGIDAAAHEGALAAGATGAGTIAVTGTGLDHVYPRQHSALAERIREHGALVSEFALGMPARPHHFPMRNRIVAGLSRGVLIVEAAARSGSLITARLANETGRDIFALPGSIHAPLARGCHELIRQGAKLVETTDDILAEFAEFAGPARAVPHSAAATTTGATGAAAAGAGWGSGSGRTVAAGPAGGRWTDGVATAELSDMPACGALLHAMGHEPIGLDALLAHSGLDAATLACELLTLELAGTVQRMADGRYQRVQR